MMKKTSTIIATITAIALSLPLVSCSKRESSLYIYNWTYCIPDDVLSEFEKENGVKIVYDVYASSEEMYTKIKGGANNYDLIVPSGDYMSILIKEGMLAKIDKSKIPNFANIDTAVLSRIHFDPGNHYSVPYILASSGIAVNKTMVKEYSRSWQIFGRRDLAGKMTMLYDMREVLGAALKTLGYSVNSVDPKQINEARDLVIRWKKNIQKFDTETFAKSFASGEFPVVQGYAENIFKEYDSSRTKDFEFFIPKEGGLMYMDNICIFRTAKHKNLAYKFIDFIHRPDIYARICDYLLLPSLNTKATALRKTKALYEISDLRNSEFKEDLGSSIKLYNNAWQEIIAEN